MIRKKKWEKKNHCFAYPWPGVGVDCLLVFELLAPPPLQDPLVDHDLPQDYRVPGTSYVAEGEGE